MKAVVCSVLCLVLPLPTLAQVVLFDSADQPAYADGWQSGDNGGSGLGPWSTISTGGLSIGSATGNGGAHPVTIDTAGKSWALASGNSVERAIVASVGVGSTLSIAYDMALAENAVSVVAVGSGADTAVIYAGLDGNEYSVRMASVGGPRITTGVPINGDGVTLSFRILEASTETTPGSLRISLTPFTGTPFSIDSSFEGSELTSLQFVGGDPVTYINSIQATAVPEPGEIAVVAGLGLGVLTVVRRRRRNRNG